MLSAKQRASLRSLANNLEVAMHIGKEGVGENSLQQISELFEARELFKVKVLSNCSLSPKEISKKVCSALNCDSVQVIGSIIVLYKRSTRKDFKHIEF